MGPGGDSKQQPHQAVPLEWFSPNLRRLARKMWGISPKMKDPAGIPPNLQRGTGIPELQHHQNRVKCTQKQRLDRNSSGVGTGSVSLQNTSVSGFGGIKVFWGLGAASTCCWPGCGCPNLHLRVILGRKRGNFPAGLDGTSCTVSGEAQNQLSPKFPLKSPLVLNTPLYTAPNRL